MRQPASLHCQSRQWNSWQVNDLFDADMSVPVPTGARFLLLIALLLSAAQCGADQSMQPLGIDTSMHLTDHKGRAFDMQQMRGKVLWVYFGFTWCPEFCPMTQSKLSRAWQQMDYRKKNLESLFITVDPERDNQRRLQDFLML